MRVGLISDTHGLIRPEALRALADADLILHAGDVGSPEVLEALRALAPVVAVRGNTDHGPWAEALPETEVADALGRLVYLLHDLAALDLDPAAAGFAAVVTGHSHHPALSERGGVLFVNPGSAGPRRFQLPITLALLEEVRGALRARWVDLESGSTLAVPPRAGKAGRPAP